MNTAVAKLSEVNAQIGAGEEPRAAVLKFAANELVFAVVGHAGSGTTTVATVLSDLLSQDSLSGGKYDTTSLKARDVIREWATSNGKEVPPEGNQRLDTVEAFQNLGDDMRLQSKDFSSVAKGLIRKIRETRAKKTDAAAGADAPVLPDGKRRAYVIDSIRHPAEVQLLRHVYQDAFVLVGVVCEETKRLTRLTKKYEDAGELKAKAFMKRDEKAGPKHGQRVADAFHLSDFFLDNTTDRLLQGGSPNPEWDINEKLNRLIRIICQAEVIRPSTAETAMHQAFAAGMRSACLSRQVGAALTDSRGNIIATGSNEVPRAGGGVYGESFEEEIDHRCAFRPMEKDKKRYCSNTRGQNEIVDKLIEEIPELDGLQQLRKLTVRDDIKRSGIGDLLEFSRAIHAEMDAILSAGREGISTVGGRLFVTTFPCHYCARHIVTAGIDEVQFIEPYPKSRAFGLHGDAIASEYSAWKPPSAGGSTVLFRPFVGVAPRLYARAFLKDRELKEAASGDMNVGAAEWGAAWHLRSASYAELEAAVVK